MAQNERLADAERALQAKPTKAVAENRRKDGADQGARLADLRRTEAPELPGIGQMFCLGGYQCPRLNAMRMQPGRPPDASTLHTPVALPPVRTRIGGHHAPGAVLRMSNLSTCRRTR